MLVGILVTHDRTGRKKKRASRTSAADAQQKLLNDLSGPTEAGRVVTAYERANGSGVPSSLTISIADLLEGVNGLFDDVISEDVANRLGIERSESEFTERLRYSARTTENDADAAKFSLRPTDTPQFKHWFKGSKVVNDDGSPKVVYHGSPNDFSVFDLSYLGTNGTAEGYSENLPIISCSQLSLQRD